MGNKQSQSKYDLQDEFKILYRNLEYYQVQKYNCQDIYVGKTVESSDSDHIQQLQSIIEHKLQSSSPFVNKLIEYRAIRQQSPCFKNWVCFYLLYNQPKHTLWEELLKRSNQRRGFSDQQIQSLLIRASKGLKYLSQIGHNHGCISAKAVIWPLNHQSVLQIKLIDEWSLNERQDYRQFYPDNLSQSNANDKVNEKLALDLYQIGTIGLKMVFNNANFSDRRQISQAIKTITNRNIKYKLQILCSPVISQRQNIYQCIEKSESSTQPRSTKQQSRKWVYQHIQDNPNYNHGKQTPQNNITNKIGSNNAQTADFYRYKATDSTPINNLNSKYPSPINAGTKIPREYIAGPFNSQYSRPQTKYQGTNQYSHNKRQTLKREQNYDKNINPGLNQYQTQRKSVSHVVVALPMSLGSNNFYQPHTATITNFGGEHKFQHNNKGSDRNSGLYFNKLNNSNSTYNGNNTDNYSKNQDKNKIGNNNNNLFTPPDFFKQIKHNLDIEGSFNVRHQQSKVTQNKINPSITEGNKKNIGYMDASETNLLLYPQFQTQLKSHTEQRGDLNSNLTEGSNESNHEKHKNIVNEQQERSDEHNDVNNSLEDKEYLKNDDEESQNRYSNTQRKLKIMTIPELSESANSNPDLHDFEDDLEKVDEIYDNGSHYIGQKSKKTGLKSGQGKFYYSEGSYYEGSWRDNSMHGFGRLFYSNDRPAYEGEWYFDQFHGKGKVYNDDPIQFSEQFDYKNFDNLEEQWENYEGTLISDSKEGEGRLTLSNGEYYEGQFQNDRVHGEGKFYTLSGKVIKGMWRDSILIKRL